MLFDFDKIPNELRKEFCTAFDCTEAEMRKMFIEDDLAKLWNKIFFRLSADEIPFLFEKGEEDQFRAAAQTAIDVLHSATQTK